MPEGPAERGVEATRARARAGARHAKSIDGAEHSGSIERVMAGQHAAPPCSATDARTDEWSGAAAALRAAALVDQARKHRKRAPGRAWPWEGLVALIITISGILVFLHIRATRRDYSRRLDVDAAELERCPIR